MEPLHFKFSLQLQSYLVIPGNLAIIHPEVNARTHRFSTAWINSVRAHQDYSVSVRGLI